MIDLDRYSAWCDGLTGMPILTAVMLPAQRELVGAQPLQMFDAKSCVWPWIASRGIDPNLLQVFNLATGYWVCSASTTIFSEVNHLDWGALLSASACTSTGTGRRTSSAGCVLSEGLSGDGCRRFCSELLQHLYDLILLLAAEFRKDRQAENFRTESLGYG